MKDLYSTRTSNSESLSCLAVTTSFGNYRGGKGGNKKKVIPERKRKKLEKKKSKRDKLMKEASKVLYMDLGGYEIIDDVSKISSDSNSFYKQTISDNRGLVNKIQREFMNIRRKNRTKNRQFFDSELDIDAAIDWRIAMANGETPEDKIFRNKRNKEKNVSVGILVDVGESNLEGRIDNIKKSLVFISEALENLQVNYAIYTFRDLTGKPFVSSLRIEKVKNFSQRLGVKEKTFIGNLSDYNRLCPIGYGVEYMANEMRKSNSETKIIIPLIDGTPQYFRDYLHHEKSVNGVIRREKAYNHVRESYIRARDQGLILFSFIMNEHPEIKPKLDNIYGKKQYVYIDDVNELPDQLVGIAKKIIY